MTARWSARERLRRRPRLGFRYVAAAEEEAPRREARPACPVRRQASGMALRPCARCWRPRLRSLRSEYVIVTRVVVSDLFPLSVRLYYYTPVCVCVYSCLDSLSSHELMHDVVLRRKIKRELLRALAVFFARRVSLPREHACTRARERIEISISRWFYNLRQLRAAEFLHSRGLFPWFLFFCRYQHIFHFARRSLSLCYTLDRAVV